MNTLLNVFTSRSLGVPFERMFCGGDDTLLFFPEEVNPSIFASNWQSLCSHCGFELKVKIIDMHSIVNPTFSLLARRFIAGEPYSLAEPMRLVPKLHVLSTMCPKE